MLGKVTNFPNGLNATGNNAAAVGVATDVLTVSGAATVGSLTTSGAVAAGILAGQFKNTIGTATATAGAATLNAYQGKVTSESLTTAQNADYTLTITNNKIAAGDIVLVSVANGTNSAGSPVVRMVTPAAGSVVVIVRNIHASAVAFNGTIVVSFQVFSA